jgi:predicted AlkP superfamily phosphohydrolase/phosphomutase
VGQYVFDVPFRRDDRDALLQEIYDMSRKRFRVIKYLLQNKEWDFFAFMEIGVDRIHHAFWKYFDPAHHLYQSSPFQSVIPDYYRYLDEEIGDLLSLLPAQTSVLIVSDHGVKRMKGAFCLNEWLVTEGYLVLKTTPPHQLGLEQADVDWGRTTAWGWGGYYARIFLNVQGREPQGVIKPEDYECFRDELAQKLQQIRGPQGEEWKTRIFKPQEIYPQTKGDCPDLMVYFDDLYWRSAGTLGHNALYLPENDTGPDDAVHSEDGIFLLYNDQQNQPRELDATIYDIAPTILHLMSAPIPPLLPGESLLWKLEQGLLPKQSPGE